MNIKNWLKNNSSGSLFSLQLLVLGLILTVTFFLLLVDVSKTYTSSINVLISAKSEVFAQQNRQIVGNIIEFPKTLAFYDRLLKYNTDIKDIASGKSLDQRKKFWNDMFSIQRVGKDSSIIKISITTKNEIDANQLAQKTARTLFDVVAMHYDIKNDIELSIIEGPAAHPNISQWYWTLPLSLILAFTIAICLRYILSEAGKLFINRTGTIRNNGLFDSNKLFGTKVSDSRQAELGLLEELYAAEQPENIFPALSGQEKTENISEPGKDESKIREMKKITKIMEPGKYPNFPEMPMYKAEKNSAPENLPIADDSFLAGDNMAEQFSEQLSLSDKEAGAKEAPSNEEPTQQQLKERLNKLLRGEL